MHAVSCKASTISSKNCRMSLFFFRDNSTLPWIHTSFLYKSVQYFSAHVCVTKLSWLLSVNVFDVLLSAFNHALCVAQHFIAECACMLLWNQIPGVWFCTDLDHNLSSLSCPTSISVVMMAHDSQVASNYERVTIHYHDWLYLALPYYYGITAGS